MRDESVARTGVISQDGYRARLRLKEMIDGDRTPDPAWTSLLKVVMSYAYGNPGKFQEQGKQRESLIFLTTNGMVPWDPRADSMSDVTSRMLAEKAAEEKLALEAKKLSETIDTADKADSEAPVESLELVVEPPENFTTGGRR